MRSTSARIPQHLVRSRHQDREPARHDIRAHSLNATRRPYRSADGDPYWAELHTGGSMTSRRLTLTFAFAISVIGTPFRALAQAPQTVTCSDGSTSKAGRGACSHHGGVGSGTGQAGVPHAQAKGPASASPAPSIPMVTCQDGTSSHGGKGACSGHGGINRNAANDNGTTAPATTGERTANPPPSPAPSRTAPAPSMPEPEPRVPPTTATQRAPMPAPSSPPMNAGQPTARCYDGTKSFSTHHSGTCSHHGGVTQWLDGSK